MLRLRLLGGLTVEADDGPVAVPGSWRARSLLAWLALHPGDHLRADLAPRFWPDVLDSSARSSLRNALWALRRALGDGADTVLVSSRERVGLAPDVWVDRLEFDRLVAAGREEEEEEAIELCRGELLAGVEEEWVHAHRDAHRDALSAALEQLARRAARGRARRSARRDRADSLQVLGGVPAVAAEDGVQLHEVLLVVVGDASLPRARPRDRHRQRETFASGGDDSARRRRS